MDVGNEALLFASQDAGLGQAGQAMNITCRTVIAEAIDRERFGRCYAVYSPSVDSSK